MKRGVMLAGFAWLCAAAASADLAHADDESVDPPALPLTVTAHRVTGTRVGRFVDFAVSRRIENPHANAAAFDVLWRLPPHGAVTNLRWRRDDDQAWVNAQVMPAKAAAAMYDRYLHGPIVLDRGPILASDESTSDGAALRVESPTLAPHHAILIEYRVSVALCYVNGTYIAPYPNGEIALDLNDSNSDAADTLKFVDAPTLVVPNAQLLTKLTEADADCGISGDNPPGWRYVAFVNQLREGIHPALHRVEVAAGGASEIVLDLGKQLELAPRRANVVFVLDASRSMSASMVAQQLNYAKEFLQALPDAKFNIVMARRKPTLLWPQFRPATAAKQLDTLAETALVLGNGSNFDAALQLAATTLHNVAGPTYLTALTDARWRKTLEAPQLPPALRELPAQTVVHVTTIANAPGRAGSDWNYHPNCDPIALAFGQRWRGMITMADAVSCDGSSEDVDHASQPSLAMQWVRPMVIEQLSADGSFMQHQVAEGMRLQFLSNEAGARVSILQGLIWGQPWTMAVAADDFTSHYFAAIAHTTELRGTMTEAEATQIALAGHAISPNTSMLAIDPRFGPTQQLEVTGRGFGGGGTVSDVCCGPDNMGTVGTGRFSGKTSVTADNFRAVANRCANEQHLNQWWVQIEAELTSDEIVDVRAISSDNAVFKHCVIEGVWEVSAFNPENLDTISVIAHNH